MLDPMDLVRLETDTPPDQLDGGVLLLHLGGFLDAGQVGKLVSDYLLEQLDHTVVASFETDQLLDYRARRPSMTFDTDRWAAFDDPSLVLYRLQDREDTPFFLLTGPEPDYQWERFGSAVLTLVQLLGVRLVISTNGIPMAVPHTRPVGMTSIATDQTLLGAAYEPVFGQVRMPGSMAALLHLRVGEAGRDALSYAVHVPQYLGESEFGDAAVAALEAVTGATGLSFPMTDLMTRAGTNRAAIEAELSDNPEATQVVAAMEEQYDQFMESRTRRALLAKEEGKLPTAEEIGAELEAFLKRAAHDEPGEHGGPSEGPGSGTHGPSNPDGPHDPREGGTAGA